MHQSILASAKRDAVNFACVFFFATTLIASYHAVVARWGDARDYFSHAGTEGPWLAVPDGHGGFTHGADTGVFRPGQTLGWTSQVCFEEGVGGVATVEFTRLAQDGLPAAQVASRTTRVPASTARCGPKDYVMRVPDDSVPAAYEGRRHIVVREGTVWPLTRNLPTYQFRVVAGPSPIDMP